MTARDTFDRLFRDHAPAAYTLAYRLLGNASDAEDLVQDAFVRAWECFDRYDPARPFWPWLHRILYHLYIDGRCRTASGRPASLDDPRVEAPTTQRDLGGRVAVLQALTTLPPTAQIVVIAVYGYELSYAEAAQLAHVRTSTVRNALRRGRARLKAQLEEVA